MDVLQSLIRDLRQMPSLDPAALAEVMANRHWPTARVARMLTGVPFDGHAHRRLVVHADERCEVVLVHLPPGAATPIHDHNDAAGYVHVASGMIINRIYRKNVCGTIALAEEQFIPKEHGCHLPEGLIHAMHNPSHVDAYTVHIYSPPFGKANIYEDVPDYIAAYI